MPLLPGKSKQAFGKNVETEMTAGKPQKQAIAIAYNMKKKGGENHAEGGICHACGGMIQNPKLEESHMSQGGMAGSYKEEESFEHTPDWDGFETSELPYGEEEKYDEEPEYYAEGGGVDNEYDPTSINDTDGDSDDLVYSPEVGEKGEEDDKKSSFLRAYMVHRKLRGR